MAAITLEAALQAAGGIRVVLARSGRDALRVLEQQSVTVTALITDLHMPFMDGFTLIARVRAHPRYASLPVIVVSGDPDPEVPRRIARLGADAFFQKPYSPAALREAVEQFGAGT